MLPLATTKGYLAGALPMTKQKRHLTSAFREIETPAAIAADPQQTPREFRVE